MATVKVKLVKTVRLLPHQNVAAIVHYDAVSLEENRPLLIELQGDGLIQTEDILLLPLTEGRAWIRLTNPFGCSCVMAAGTYLGEAVGVEAVTSGEARPEEFGREIQHEIDYPNIHQILPELGIAERKKLLRELVPQERGETKLVEMEICTGNAEPVKQNM